MSSPGRVSVPTVTYWQNQASPYMVARFNTLNARGNVRLDAIFSRMRAPDRNWRLDRGQWGFRSRTLSGGTVRRVSAVLAHLRRERPQIFIAEYDRPDFFLALICAPAFVDRTAARVLPTFAAWSKRTPAREAAKHVVFRSLSAATVSGPEAVALAERHGLPADRTFRMTQSIDVAHYATALDVPEAERIANRHELGLSGCVFAYVGRLWAGKGIDTLIAAFRGMAGEDASLLLVGAGVDEQRYREMTKDLPNVVFAGFRDPTEIPAIYALADVLVLPTLGDPHGLVVEEAMAAGLPVISTSAAGHIRERIDEGVTGYVVPPEDAAALQSRMRVFVTDPARAARMGAIASERVADLGHVRWAEDFERFVDGTLSLPRRGRLRG